MIKIGNISFERYDKLLSAALRESQIHGMEPKCDCTVPGVPLQIVNLRERRIVRKGKNTGQRHARNCEFYQLPGEFAVRTNRVNGPFQVNNKTGITKVSVNFSLSITHEAQEIEHDNEKSDTSKDDANGGEKTKPVRSKLELAAFFNYLLDESGLNVFDPDNGRGRRWWQARTMLMDAACSTAIGSILMRDVLYIPEQFDLDQKDEIRSRRIERFTKFISFKSSKKNLMIVMGEIKFITLLPSKCQIVLKQAPDCIWSMSLQLFKKIDLRFNKILNLWNPDQDHLLSMALVEVDEACCPIIRDITLVLTNHRWIPFKNETEQHFLQGLMDEGRRFVTVLQIDAPSDEPRPFVVLTDTIRGITPIYVLDDQSNDRFCSQTEAQAKQNSGVIWWPDLENYPKLPHRRS